MHSVNQSEPKMTRPSLTLVSSALIPALFPRRSQSSWFGWLTVSGSAALNLIHPLLFPALNLCEGNSEIFL